MPRKSSNKKGAQNKKGGAFAYVQQFDYPLSPCYRPNNKAPIPKLGWHAGGANGESCDSQLSVEKMGIVDKPASDKLTASEVAWDNRYDEPKKTLSIQGMQDQKGGAKKKILKQLERELNSNKSSNVISIDALRGGKNKLINVVNVNDKFIVSITDKDSNKSQFLETSSSDKVSKKIQQYNLIKLNKSKKL